MTIVDLSQIEEREIVPGFHARFLHSEHMTLAYWRIEAGASLPEHAHPHEQVTNLLEGEFEFEVDGALSTLRPGSAVVIPGNVRHQGRALSDCRILDIFYPVRDDYRR